MKYLTRISILCLFFGVFSCGKVTSEKTVSVEINLLNNSESTITLSSIVCPSNSVEFYPPEIILPPHKEWHITKRVSNYSVICICPTSLIISNGDSSVHQSIDSPANGICNQDNFIRISTKNSSSFTFTITDSLLTDWFK